MTSAVGRPGAPVVRSPADWVLVRVEVGDVLDGRARCGLEVGAFRVGDGNKPGLGHVRRDAEQFGGFPLQSEVEGGVATAQTSARSASWKLHIAGMMEPIKPAAALVMPPPAGQQEPDRRGDR